LRIDFELVESFTAVFASTTPMNRTTLRYKRRQCRTAGSRSNSPYVVALSQSWRRTTAIDAATIPDDGSALIRTRRYHIARDFRSNDLCLASIAVPRQFRNHPSRSQTFRRRIARPRRDAGDPPLMSGVQGRIPNRIPTGYELAAYSWNPPRLADNPTPNGWTISPRVQRAGPLPQQADSAISLMLTQRYNATEYTTEHRARPQSS